MSLRHRIARRAAIALFAAASLGQVACSDIASDEQHATDSFAQPTMHGELRFDVPNPATFTEDQRFHAWSFTLSAGAQVALRTELSTTNLDSVIYLYRPAVADYFQQRLPALYRLLVNKFYFDELYQKAFVARTVSIGNGLWRRADAGLIDGVLVNGSARLMGSIAERVREWQSGYLFHYAFAMIIGLIGILGVWVML